MTATNPRIKRTRPAYFKSAVENYIHDVTGGSRSLARSSGLDLSAATIRNVMADLEEMGYIQPHTSAGRIPTSRVIACLWIRW